MILINQIVLEARGLKLKGDNTVDAFVDMNLEGQHFTTSVAYKSVRPGWTENNEFTHDLFTTEEDHFYLDLKLLHKRAGKVDQPIGEILIKLIKRAESRFADKWYTLMRKGKTTAEIRVQLHFLTKEDLQQGSICNA